MGRPKGAKNKPGYKKPGKKVDLIGKYLTMTANEGLAVKAAVLELLSTGKAMNLTAAALKLNLNPTKLKYYADTDPDFKNLCHTAKEVKADMLEDELANNTNFIPKMMILKGLKPQYRDSYKFDLNSDKLETLFRELSELKDKPKMIESKTEVVETIVQPIIEGIVEKETEVSWK